MTTKTDAAKIEFHNYAGTLAAFSIESLSGIRIELKRGLAYIDPDEARTLAHWLLAAADSIDPQPEGPAA
jgi:hypothetical protein